MPSFSFNSTNRSYFLAVAMTNNMVGSASLKEKEMVASLFCKLANLMRTKSTCFGSDTKVRRGRMDVFKQRKKQTEKYRKKKLKHFMRHNYTKKIEKN